MNLEQLIKACKKQNLKAQGQLYQRYKDELYSLCLKYCKNKAAAEDNIQDAFLEIFSKIRSYKGQGSFVGWMKRIVINKAIDKYKKDTHVDIVINNDILEDYIIDMQNIETLPLNVILSHIQKLPSQYRLVFNLYILDNYSHKEISKLLSISEGTSKSNLHRAKLILKEKLKTHKPN